MKRPKQIKVKDVNIKGEIVLPTPQDLQSEYPLTDRLREFVFNSRETVKSILEGKDDRFLVIVGPCSIHDEVAALEYAEKLAKLRKELKDHLFIVMRTYFEKPRTTVGWKGLLKYPNITGGLNPKDGLMKARRILKRVNELNVPCATEALETISPQYFYDLVTYASIGARSSEDQVHRDLASGLSMPVGFKNATFGDITPAINGIIAARAGESFFGVTQDGKPALFETSGNPYAHLILRGGSNGPNYNEDSISAAARALKEKGLLEAIVVDCSHGNSQKDHTKQPEILKQVVSQRVAGQKEIKGAMLESFLKEGNQKLPSGNFSLSDLEYGKSITDACISWETTEALLREVAKMLR